MEIPVRWKELICGDCGQAHKVIIFKEGCKYRVEPGRLIVHPGARVRFISLVPHFEIMFPEEVKAVAGGNKRKVRSGNNVSFVINAGPGCYPYSVYVPSEGGGDFAEGGSSPRIIVADP